MSSQYLQMKYHPAKKEVEFRRFSNGKEVTIKKGSKLEQYMIKDKGNFVLQDHGNAFFNDIAKVFDGLESININVITTEADYEDFEQMVEFYNKSPKEGNKNFRITSKLIATLPNMTETYKAVKQFGEKAIVILGKQAENLRCIDTKTKAVKESAEGYAKQIDKEVSSIKEKISNLSDTNVNLCFSGAYSSGKSALINAILGYRILPEDIKSETAKMFRILSPKENEKESICFDIKEQEDEKEIFIKTALIWNGNFFDIKEGPTGSETRTEIQEILNSFKDTAIPLHEMIAKILAELNKQNNISSKIDVVFPIPLDNDNVRFTIYDTPGTDSNNAEHQEVLREAIENQTQSIMIFVIKPDGLEGSGNDILLNTIKDKTENNKNTYIDMGRSIFVINKADTCKSSDRIKLEEEKIQDKKNGDFSIELKDKKLYFAGYVQRSSPQGAAF